MNKRIPDGIMIVMLKKIKDIKEVGGIKKLVGDPSCISLKKNIIIYGLNGYGKTAIATILDGVGQDEVSGIKDIKSIPTSPENAQEIVITFLDEKNEEKDIVFGENGWVDNFQKDKIFVFDNDFIHRNLISGTNIDADTKKNFSEFIIGEKGVKMAKALEEIAVNLVNKNKELKKPRYIEDNEDKEREFLDLNVQENIETLRIDLDNKNKKIENLKNISKIKILPEIEIIKNEDILNEKDIFSILERLNKIFAIDYGDITKEALENISAHIRKCIKGDEEKANKWLADGTVSFLKDDDCPFCGQELKNVSELIDSYKKSFNTKYEEFIKRMEISLKEETEALHRFSFAFDKLRNVIFDINKYSGYDEGIIIKDEKLLEIENTIKDLNNNLNKEKDNIIDRIEKKRSTPHNEIEEYSFSKDFEEILGKAKKDLLEMTKNVNKIIEKTVLFKSEYNVDTEKLGDKIKESQAEFDFIDMKIKRLEQDDNCIQYNKHFLEIKKLKNAKKETKEQLEKEQMDYLDQYFDKFNKNYTDLGNGKYTLDKKIDKRGNTSKCALVVKLFETELKTDQISISMSDSEKRSLAFALFLTKLDFVEDQSKKIVVLDDPVVSFDENRVRITASKLQSVSNNFEQVLVLTHYRELIFRLIEQSRDKDNISTLELSLDGSDVRLEKVDREKFTKTILEKRYEELHNFVEGENISEDVYLNSRLYIEERLRIKYLQKNINIGSLALGKIIEKLYEKGLMSKEDKDEALRINNLIKVDHHPSPEIVTIEEKKLIVRAVLDFCKKL